MNNIGPLRFLSLPPIIKNLIIINALFFLATIAFERMNIDLVRILGLHYPSSDNFKPLQFVTYMFMHGNLGHIFFNMFAVWMFGNALENLWGPKRFLIYYFATGLGAGLIHLLVTYIRIQSVQNGLSEMEIQTVYNEGAVILSQGQNYMNGAMATLNRLINTPTVGASGAVFGMLLAFGMTFPNSMIYVYFAIPVRAKYFVMIYGAIELFSGVANKAGDNVAHFAHLGGMLFGYFLIRYWNKNRTTF